MCYLFSSFSAKGIGYVKELASRCDYSYYLLGGAGNGKSTILNNVADAFRDRNVDYIYCSYDPNSLDGILINNRILLFDGTNPHNVLPTKYKLNGEIVDVGVSIGDVEKSKNEIIGLMQKEDEFKSKYLACGRALSEYLKIETELLDKPQKLAKQAEIFVESVKTFDNDSILYDAYMKSDYYGAKKKYVFMHKNKIVAGSVLKYVGDLLDNKGIKCLKYHSLYYDGLLEGIETKNAFIGINGDGESINLNYEADIGYEWCDLLNRIKKYQREAISCHKAVERAYRPYVDFDLNSELQDKLIKTIEKRLSI